MLLSKTDAKIILTILVAALGYFVDIYDLILFSIVRIPSLKALNLTDTDLLGKGVLLLNIQMIGMLLGGVFFGILADKKGRLSVLFASILLYSVANILNAYVTNVNSYAVLRFLAGFGLSGELGIGVTLVSELLPREKKGHGTIAIATLGMCGALLAWPIVKHFDWRSAYLLGGIMGIALLCLRLGVLESELFKKQKFASVKHGDFLALFRNKDNFLKFLACTLLGVQLWYGMGILITLSPEFTTALNISKGVVAGEAIFHCYLGVIFGGFLCGIISQYLKSRKKALILFMTFSSAGIITFFFLRNLPTEIFYMFCFLIGLTTGYWAIFVQNAVEQFGTNLRATAATSVTNFGRATLVPLSMLFMYLKKDFGLYTAGLSVGVFAILLSSWPLFYLKESFNKDLDYLDT